MQGLVFTQAQCDLLLVVAVAAHTTANPAVAVVTVLPLAVVERAGFHTARCGHASGRVSCVDWCCLQLLAHLFGALAREVSGQICLPPKILVKLIASVEGV